MNEIWKWTNETRGFFSNGKSFYAPRRLHNFDNREYSQGVKQNRKRRYVYNYVILFVFLVINKSLILMLMLMKWFLDGSEAKPDFIWLVLNSKVCGRVLAHQFQLLWIYTLEPKGIREYPHLSIQARNWNSISVWESALNIIQENINKCTSRIKSHIFCIKKWNRSCYFNYFKFQRNSFHNNNVNALFQSHSFIHTLLHPVVVLCFDCY